MIKLIIFDLDGLLVDSQPLQYEAVRRKPYSVVLFDEINLELIESL